MAWRDPRILDLFGIETPILQAPMAGTQASAMAIAVSQAGGLGGLPTAVFGPAQVASEIGAIRAATNKPFNVNFFCHTPPHANADAQARWITALKPAFDTLGVAPPIPGGPGRAPFDDALCRVVEEHKPPVVSFHFGLPEESLLKRVRATGAKIISSATTVAEARWLEARGVDAIVAQGAEAGGHRGIFLNEDAAMQPGTFALVPQVVDAVKVPVIAAGGIGDARGVAAALTLGASAVQPGTIFLFCPEATIPALYREALSQVRDDQTVLTNVFTGRPARAIANRFVREIGPMSPDALPFPLAAGPVAALRAASEKAGSPDFMQMWSGQAARLGRAMPAGELIKSLTQQTLALLG